MKELPILFSTPMVQALLAGRKTMTRRTKGLEDINKFLEMGYSLRYDSIEDGPDENGYVYFEINDHKGNPTEKYCKAKPKYYIGDLLWVKETIETELGQVNYKAGNPEYIHNTAYRQLTKWTPSIFMPKAAARIWLKVTGVKCEMLQDISDNEARLEGWGSYTNSKIKGDNCDGNSPKLWFKKLWISINGAERWNSNPWVFAYTFEIISTTGKPDESQI